MMRALVLEQFKTMPTPKEVQRPTPGPGEVLLKIAVAGACHSDVGIFHDFETDPTGLMTPPFILGHENSGWVEEIGEGVTGVEVGAAYLCYGPRNLVPLGDADPIDAAPLADAGLTPYHAIKRVLLHLAGGGKSALVIGLGGLGMIGVQILKALTGATVIATDMKAEAMADAEKYGAVAVPGGEGQAERIRELSGGRGVDAVFDFVGVDPTMALAASVVAQRGAVTIVGIGGGTYPWNFFGVPYEVNFSSTYWGTIEDLHEVVAMYRAGRSCRRLSATHSTRRWRPIS